MADETTELLRSLIESIKFAAESINNLHITLHTIYGSEQWRDPEEAKFRIEH